MRHKHHTTVQKRTNRKARPVYGEPLTLSQILSILSVNQSQKPPALSSSPSSSVLVGDGSGGGVDVVILVVVTVAGGDGLVVGFETAMLDDSVVEDETDDEDKDVDTNDEVDDVDVETDE